MGSVARSEDFCGSLCSAGSHEGFIVGVTVTYFSAIDHIYIKCDSRVVPGFAAVRSTRNGGDAVAVAFCVSEVEHGLEHFSSQFYVSAWRSAVATALGTVSACSGCDVVV